MTYRHWIVPDLLPAGLALLAGPEEHLSDLALQIALGVSLGQPVLGRPVGRCLVLYLALNDGLRRLSARLRAQAANLPVAASRVDFATDWPELAHGGLDQLRVAVDGGRYPFIVIDTFSAALGDEDRLRVGRRHSAVYDIHDLTRFRPVTILLVEPTPPPARLDGLHLRADLDDLMDTVDPGDNMVISGTADTLLFLYRRPRRRSLTLGVIGRDMVSLAQPVRWAAESRLWLPAGPATTNGYRTVARH